ncbi:Protein transport protein sec20 [Coelomomyces lativittatus]|nr:Protein transport protein sec20 [Coelomomyces lativittatus]KAJ1509404.1 Protein transport protein sec20 [Coelomomyces lativittatus]
MEDSFLTSLDRHADQVQSILSKMNTLLKTDLPQDFPSPLEWQTQVNSLREALNDWQESSLNAKDYFEDLHPSEKKKTWLHALSQNQQLKLIYEASFRNYVTEYRKQAQKQSFVLRQNLMKRETETRFRGASSSLSSVASKNPQDDRALHVAATATDTLKRMTQVMATELEKSMQNMMTLNAQTKMVKQTHSEYSTMTHLLMGAKQRLSQLEQRERTDKILMYFGCLVFLCVVLYILKKRVFSYLF